MVFFLNISLTHPFIVKYNHLIIYNKYVITMYNIQFKIPVVNQQKYQEDELMGKI